MKRPATAAGVFITVSVLYDLIVQACRLISARNCYSPEYALHVLAALDDLVDEGATP